MANTILEDLKFTLGLLPDNLGFDLELLIFLNSAKSNLIQLGVTEMDVDIDETTPWPVFSSDIVRDLSKHYLSSKARQIFDPTASETIAKTISSSITELESRITHEVEESAVP